ncbi:hypothetical protein ACFU7T_22090 [Streptomyces sp. NPDC057555]|uniref:hypothetical protein n=1 Tax=Streptomyces sp. NPDC057555 TaxID=3346166 RepID=UPI00367B7D5B
MPHAPSQTYERRALLLLKALANNGAFASAVAPAAVAPVAAASAAVAPAVAPAASAAVAPAASAAVAPAASAVPAPAVAAPAVDCGAAIAPSVDCAATATVGSSSIGCYTIRLRLPSSVGATENMAKDRPACRSDSGTPESPTYATND